MDSLPPEVFENIFSRIASRKDLVALRSLNRFFNARFTASAFRGLDFYDPPKNPDRLPSVAHSHLAPYITHLLFNLDSVRLGHIVTGLFMPSHPPPLAADSCRVRNAGHCGHFLGHFRLL